MLAKLSYKIHNIPYKYGGNNMALGILTIRPDSPEEIEPHIRLAFPGEPLTTKRGDTTAKMYVYNRSLSGLDRAHLASFALSKNVKGPSGIWYRERVGRVEQFWDVRNDGIARVYRPGQYVWGCVSQEPRFVHIEVKDFTLPFDENTFCLKAIAKASFETVHGMPDARGTEAFRAAAEYRQSLLLGMHGISLEQGISE